MILEIRLFLQRRKEGRRLARIVKRNGHLIFNKQNEMTTKFLAVDKRVGKEVEANLYKGWLDALEWLIRSE